LRKFSQFVVISAKNIGGGVECQHDEDSITLVEVRNNLHYKVKELPMDVCGSPMLAGDPSCVAPASLTSIPYETRNFHQFESPGKSHRYH
jgi:hypothetical protein